MVDKDFLLAHFTAFRGLLTLCCVGYALILYGWLRPNGLSVRRGLLATLIQFWFGFWGDQICVRLGAWSYREMPFSYMGIPIDLHLDWSLIWGLGICWLSDRWPGAQGKGFHAALYLGAWTLFTVLFDAGMAQWLLFLDSAATWWWAADLAFLALVQGFTLWLYRSMGLAYEKTCGLGRLPPVSPLARSFLYFSFFLPFFYLYLPSAILDLARNRGWSSPPLSTGVSAWILIVPSCGLGAWALYEFALRGRGTPVPWDPPKELVVTGPYAWIANPMQVSGLLLTVAVFASSPCWAMGLYLLDVWMMAAAVFAVFEPQGLRERFGDSYSRYSAEVKNWRVRSKAWTPSGGV